MIVSVPVWLLLAGILALFAPMGFLAYSVMESRGKIGALEQEKNSLLASQNQQLERELELAREREKQARAEGRERILILESKIKQLEHELDLARDIQVLMTTKHRVLDDGWFSTVTERANLFLVLAGGRIKAGYLGEEAITEDQLRRVLETMKIVSDIVGCGPGSVVTKTVERIFQGRRAN